MRPNASNLIDALEGDGRKTIPGALRNKGAGVFGKNDDVNGEIRDREAVIQRLLGDPEVREDVIDIVTALQRQHEKVVPYERVRADLKKAGRL